MCLGEVAAGEAGGVVWGKDAGGDDAVEGAVGRGVVLAVEDDGMGFGPGDVGVLRQLFLRGGPDGERRCC